MKKILVIEDEESLRELICDLLKANGYETVCSGNGREGLEKAEIENPDLILCDVLMPGMDGYEVLAAIRNGRNINPLIPFILLTGKSERESFRKGMEMGADDFIPKPFTETELLNAIAAQLKKAELKLNHLQSSQENSDSPAEPDKNNSKEDKKLEIDDRIFLNVEDQPRLLKAGSLKCITALGDYTSIYTGENEKLIVRKTMKEWEDLLPAKYFIRIHRSYIINLDYVQKIEKWFNRALKVYMQGINKPFVVSRRYSSRLKEL